MEQIKVILKEIARANTVDQLSALRVKLASSMATVLAKDLAVAKRERASEWSKIKAEKKSVAEADRALDMTEIAAKVDELELFWEACVQTLNGLASRINSFRESSESTFLD